MFLQNQKTLTDVFRGFAKMQTKCNPHKSASIIFHTQIFVICFQFLLFQNYMLVPSSKLHSVLTMQLLSWFSKLFCSDISISVSFFLCNFVSFSLLENNELFR